MSDSKSSPSKSMELSTDVPLIKSVELSPSDKQKILAFAEKHVVRLVSIESECKKKGHSHGTNQVVCNETRVQNYNGDTGVVRWYGNAKTRWGKGMHAFVQYDVAVPENPDRSDGVFEGERLVPSGDAAPASCEMVPVRHLYFEVKPQCVQLVRSFFGERVAPIHDDEILKYWIARHFNCKKTLEMIAGHLEWLSDVKISIEREWFHPDVAKYFPMGVGEGTDTDGNILFFSRPGLGGKMKPHEFVKKFQLNTLARWYSVMLEDLKQRIRGDGYKHGRHVTAVYDLDGVGMVYPSVIEFAKVISSAVQEHNPEVIGRVFLINCSVLFRSAYKIISVFLDERVCDKIKVYGSNCTADLTKHIKMEYLPTFVGGQNDSWLNKCGRIGAERPSNEAGEWGVLQGSDDDCVKY